EVPPDRDGPGDGRRPRARLVAAEPAQRDVTLAALREVEGAGVPDVGVRTGLDRGDLDPYVRGIVWSRHISLPCWWWCSPAGHPRPPLPACAPRPAGDTGGSARGGSRMRSGPSCARRAWWASSPSHAPFPGGSWSAPM